MDLKPVKMRPGAAIIDIGAFKGKVAKELSEAFPKSMVYAIEADPVNYKFLKNNCKKCNNIRVYNVAINRCACATDIYIAKSPKYKEKGIKLTSQANSMFEEFVADKGKIRKITVPGITLDEFCIANKIGDVGLLKINCEGCEFKLFTSTTNFLERTGAIYLALHGGKFFSSDKFEEQKININNMLIQAGFVCVAGPGLTKIPITKLRPMAERQAHIIQMWIKK